MTFILIIQLQADTNHLSHFKGYMYITVPIFFSPSPLTFYNVNYASGLKFNRH